MTSVARRISRWRSSRLVRSRRDRGVCRSRRSRQDEPPWRPCRGSRSEEASSHCRRGFRSAPQLVGSAKEGLLALRVGVGLGVLAELMEEEVVEVVGAKVKGANIGVPAVDRAGWEIHEYYQAAA